MTDASARDETSPGLRIRVVRVAELGPRELADWARLQETHREFESPFFRPEFTVAAAAIWDRVRVAVMELGGETVGFLPFERHWFGIGRPVAPLVSDYQGVIVRDGVGWTAEQLLSGSGISVVDFNHLIASQVPLKPHMRRIGRSWSIDLSGGFDGYTKSRREAGSNVISQLARLGRKLEREVGPLAFEMDSRDPSLLDWVARRKSETSGGTGHRDALAIPSVRRLFDGICSSRGEAFAGMCAALRTGDRVAAALIGLRSRTVWHCSFLGYDESLSKYSPGLLLLLRMAEAAAGAGLSKIDLGKGNSPYKQRLTDGGTDLAEARIEAPGAGAAFARTLARARDRIRRSGTSGPARRLYRWYADRR